MSDKVKNVIEEIESGKRSTILGLKFTLEEYLSKNQDGKSFLEYLINKDLYIWETYKLKNSVEAALIYLSLEKRLWEFDLSEEQLLTNINGKTFIELMLEKKDSSVQNLLKNIKENIEIVDKLIENNEISYLDCLSDELVKKLMTRSSDGNYPIEKYFTNESIIRRIIPLIKSPKELIGLCEKYQLNHLLLLANVETLMYRLDNGKTLLEDLYNKNKIPNNLKNIPKNEEFIKFLIDKEYYEYLEKADESVLSFKIESDKTLLEILVEKNKINKINDSIYYNDTIKLLYNINRLDLIKKINEDMLLKTLNEILGKDIQSDELFIEYMLKKGHNPLLETWYISKEKIVKIYCEQGYYEFLGEKGLSDKLLLTELSNGMTVIDKLLDENVNIKFASSKLKSEIIAKKLLEKNRIDLLIYGELDLLFEIAKEDKSYLDYILVAVKNKQIKCNLNELLRYQSNHNKARLYILVSKYDMNEYLSGLSVDDLLKKEDDKTLLEELLELDQDLTINKIISPDVKSNMKIAIILKSKNIEQNTINIPLENSQFDKEYIKGVENKHGIGPILSEGESLLNQLYQLFINDGKSDPELISALISGYRQSLLVNYELNLQELRNLVTIKEQNPSKFIYIKEREGAFFSPLKGSINCEKNHISTILHETGHALHHYLKNSEIPKEYTEIIKRTRKDPEITKKVETFANKYEIVINKIKLLAEKKYQQFFESYFDSKKMLEIDEFLNKKQEEKKEEFKTLGLSDECLDTILGNMFTTEEYFEQQKRIIINEYVEDIIRGEFEIFCVIGDILDAIYEGELFSGELKNESGKKIKRTAGHGISYYSNQQHGFDEMIANFSYILKTPNLKENLDIIRQLIGEEAFNMINDFYINNIIYSNADKLKQGKNL